MECEICYQKINGTVVLIGEAGHEAGSYCYSCGMSEVEYFYQNQIYFDVNFDEIEEEQEEHHEDIDHLFECWREERS